MIERIHFVRENDTLQRIAAFYWGDWTVWPLIRDSNTHLYRIIGFDWTDKLKEGIPLRIRIDIPTSDIDHTVLEGDTYESLSLLYYFSEHFSERIRIGNERKILRYEIGNKINIPALVDRRTFQAAKERLKIWP
ncbi:phage tail protein [Leptospira licerasiae]|uniref:phage tail protein n=1 Tax=Leptospira licerasiae TaxID=447106 RepID=UPI0010837EFB|nr:phage tail protein [Leptospira licerasiae]TGM88490.1 phage tail protein [Leptospira licerasiae]